MEKKKETKLIVLICFLVVAIKVICDIGSLIYNLKSQNIAMLETQEQLNSKIENLENQISNANNEEKDSVKVENNMTYSSLAGKYIGDAVVEPGTTPDGETQVLLYLYENGNYKYNNEPGLSSGHAGYYTFNGNNLVLHKVVGCANDVSRYVEDGIVALKINDDGSVSDSDLKATLNKSSDKIEEYNVISAELKTGIKNNALN